MCQFKAIVVQTSDIHSSGGNALLGFLWYRWSHDESLAYEMCECRKKMLQVMRKSGEVDKAGK